MDVNTAEFVDRYITAEIMPWEEAKEKFGEDVANHLHNDLYPLLIHTCSKRCKPPGGQCKYGYPKPFSPNTIIAPNRPPVYRR